MENQELIKVVEESGLETTQSQIILEKFTGFFELARNYEIKAKSIIVTDPSQTDKMLEARETRLELKKIRVEAENTRKSLKEKSLREGKAIDGIGNVIKALIIPLEEHLEKQEKYAEIIEENKKNEILQNRLVEIAPYLTPEQLPLYDFKNLSDEEYSNLFKMVKEAFENKKKVEEQAEQERQRIEKEKEAENKKIREENEILARQAKEANEAKARLEKEKRDQEEKEILEKARLIEEERQKALAPEKEKLLDYVNAILIHLEDVSPIELSEKGNEIVSEIIFEIKNKISKITEKISKL